MTNDALPKNTKHSVAEMAEDIIAAMLQESIPSPFCWIVCYEDRPLQGAPQNSTEPHIMIFSTSGLAHAFVQGRERYFGAEPVQVVPIDSPATLLKLALARARDSRYSAPPCGLLLNFSYSTAQADKTLLPSTVQASNEKKLTKDLGLKVPEHPKEKMGDTDKKEADSPSTCPLCGELLYTGGGVLIGFGNEALSSLQKRATPEHTAYVCRKCGTRICKSCATRRTCPQCGNNTFDRFDLAAIASPSGLAKKDAREKPDLPLQTVNIKIPVPVPAQRPERGKLPWWAYAAMAAVVIVIIVFIAHPWSRKDAGPTSEAMDLVRTQAAETVLANMQNTNPPDTGITSEQPAVDSPAQNLVPGPEPVILADAQAYGMEVAFSPLGNYLASGSCHGDVRTWLTDSGQLFKDFLSDGADCVSDIAYTADEDRIAVAYTNQGRIDVFDVQSGSLIGTLFLSRVDQAVFSPDGHWLAGGSQGNGTAIWDVSDLSENAGMGLEPVLIESADTYFTCLQFSPASNLLAFGEGYGGLNLWDVTNQRLLETLEGDCQSPDSIRFSQDGQYLNFSDTNNLRVYSMETGELFEQIDFAFDVDSATAFSHSQEIAAVIRTEPGNSTIEIWNYRTNQMILELKGHTGPIFSLEFDADGHMLLSGGNDFSSAEVYLWNLTDVLP